MNFTDLNLSKALLNALADQELSTPTDIQQKSFSTIMSGRDVVGVAQTGTGKTLAYVLPLLRLWKFAKDPYPRILIVVPTRELTLQVKSEIDKLTTYMDVITVAAYGGVNIKVQSGQVMNGCDIVVATPGRLRDLIVTKALRAKYIKKLVIDEVDQMLVLGFKSQLKAILDLLPAKRQNLLFSATFGDDVGLLIDDYFNNPKRIIAAESGTPLDNITQGRYSVPNFYTKINLLNGLMGNIETFNKVIIFINTKKMADLLYSEINELYPDTIGVIHSNKSQNNRLDTVDNFDAGVYRLLIATDILARGIDLTNVSHVINFEIPQEAESYVHRIGRTGRAEKAGQTLSFVVESEEEMIEEIQELMDFQIPTINLPQDLEISEELLPREIETVTMPNMDLKNPVKGPSGAAFHAKSDKRIVLTADEARLKKRRKRSIEMNKKKPKRKRK